MTVAKSVKLAPFRSVALVGLAMVLGCASTDVPPPVPAAPGTLEVLAFRLGQGAGEPDDVLLGDLLRWRRPQTTLVVYDASMSMANPVGEGQPEPRFEPARDGLRRYLERTAAKDRQGLVAFGHRKPTGGEGTARRRESCLDIEVLVAPDQNDDAAVSAWIRSIVRSTHRGDTPLADAVQKAREALSNLEGDRRIVVVTDGLDECEGRFDEVAREVGRDGIRLHVIAPGIGVDRHGRRDPERAAQIERMLRDAVNAGRGQLELPASASDVERGMLRIELAALGFDVRSPAGELVARGNVGQVVALPSGRYTVVLGLEDELSAALDVFPGGKTQLMVGLGESTPPRLRVVTP